jgi:hypothetical protein
MAKALVAAWGGLIVGWVGFGWMLSVAPAGEIRVGEVPVSGYVQQV